MCCVLAHKQGKHPHSACKCGSQVGAGGGVWGPALWGPAQMVDVQCSKVAPAAGAWHRRVCLLLVKCCSCGAWHLQRHVCALRAVRLHVGQSSQDKCLGSCYTCCVQLGVCKSVHAGISWCILCPECVASISGRSRHLTSSSHGRAAYISKAQSSDKQVMYLLTLQPG